MFPKFETTEQFSEYVKKLRGEIEEYLKSRIDLEELFGAQKPNREDAQQTIDFVRHIIKHLPVYTDQRKRLADEYLAGRDDVSEEFKDLMLAFINVGTDLYWYVDLQQILKDSGATEDEIEVLRQEYLETFRKL